MGCDNSDGGLDGARTLSSLTADDFVEWCESAQPTATQIEGGKKLGCFLSLLGSQACTEESLAECVAEAEPPEVTCEPPTAEELAELEDCEATVDQMQACQDGYGDLLETLAGYTCADAEENGLELGVPAACVTLGEICPEFAADDV